MNSSTDNQEQAGGTRYNLDKPGGWWYMPLLGLNLVAPVAMRGARKYAPLDWMQGQSYSTLLDCAMRHMLKVLTFGPHVRNPGDGNVLHLAQVVWNLLCLLTLMELGRVDCDDVTPWRGVTAARRDDVARRIEEAREAWNAQWRAEQAAAELEGA